MIGRSIRPWVVLASVLGGSLAAPGFPRAADGMRTAYVRMNAASHEEFADGVRFAENLGAVLRHRVYPYAAIGEIPEGARLSIAALHGVREVFVGQVPEQDMASMSPHERYLAKAYNAVNFPLRGVSDGAFTEEEVRLSAEAVPIDPGPLRIPDEYLEQMSVASGVLNAAPTALPPTSEFMLGHLAIGVIMPESDGVGTHDWLESEEEDVVEEVISAMDYWAKYAPENNLIFTYEINYRVPVRIEPLDRGGWTIEDKWAGMSLSSLGFEGANHFAQSYAYVEAIRERYQSDWGFLIFILHGKEGQSLGSMLAYSYLGGPFNVNVSSNGDQGTENLDRVIAHETGHTFYTLDEYQASPHDCSARCGYLDVENANKIDGGSTCKISVSCIMRGADRGMGIDDLPPCVYTCGQVGWWDEDGDGIPDVLDTDPMVESFAVDLEQMGAVMAGDTLYSTSAAFNGVAASVPLANRNTFSEVAPRDVTIEPVRAEYRLDGGEWAPCDPQDGRFDDPREPFGFVIPELAPWARHTVEVRAVTLHGNVTPGGQLQSLGFFTVPPVGGKALVALSSSNPARPPVSITFAPSHPSGLAGISVPVQLAVYDVMGRMIATLEDGDFETGRLYSARWDGCDSNGKRVPAGVYAIGMRNMGRMTADKMLVIP